MAHHISAIITDAAGIAAIGVAVIDARATPLTDTLFALALTDEIVTRIVGPNDAPIDAPIDAPTDEPLDDGIDDVPDWEKVTPDLVERLQSMIPSAFAVIETEYFGGDGTQRAAAWHGATTLLSPCEDDDAVNDALAALGVCCGDAGDEWDAVGLVRFRSNDDLLEAALSTDGDRR